MSYSIKDANLNFENNYETRNKNDITAIVLHHSAANNQSVKDIHQYHIGQGYAGIGYHFYVRKNGTIWRGRPELWVGAHTYGHNDYTIGICAEGNFEKDEMWEEQIESLKWLVSYIENKYPKIKNIYMHKELDATACPGKNYPFNEISKGGKFVFVELPELRKGDKGIAVRTLQRCLSGKWNEYKDDDGKLIEVTGIFDQSTYEAILKLQKNRHLEQDGIVGRNTWYELLLGKH